ncbi:SRPBCC family protein [Yinghuangia seranimata]|uniref:SRPBCC family protein n=1 Tax=Yinghuangia seranimata TaxID=408067 RepID=UPI00248D184C|nr:SRPBCC family protein [Yinghuangia seranimata]MDI2132310.1 SRPBCC family protein [Yinghuangia seranimata]
MATHERAVEVAAPQDTVFHLLADPHRIPDYLDAVVRVEEHGPDSVWLTAAERDGTTHRSILRTFADWDLWHVSWELDSPRCRGEVAVTPGPDMDGWNSCIVRAKLDDTAWGLRPDGTPWGHAHAPGRFGGSPGYEGLAIGNVSGHPGLVDPQGGGAVGPGETLERALAGLRDFIAAARLKT